MTHVLKKLYNAETKDACKAYYLGALLECKVKGDAPKGTQTDKIQTSPSKEHSENNITSFWFNNHT